MSWQYFYHDLAFVIAFYFDAFVQSGHMAYSPIKGFIIIIIIIIIAQWPRLRYGCLYLRYL
jgi:hypothetical protein